MRTRAKHAAPLEREIELRGFYKHGAPLEQRPHSCHHTNANHSDDLITEFGPI